MTCTRCHAAPYKDGACFASDCPQGDQPKTMDRLRVQHAILCYGSAMYQLGKLDPDDHREETRLKHVCSNALNIIDIELGTNLL